MSTTTNDSDYVYASSDGECVTTKRYLCCYDELIKVEASKISMSDVNEYDADIVGFKDIL